MPLFLLAAAAYYPALKAGYLNWDDTDCVIGNPLAKNFSAAGLKEVFTQPRSTNYHPLTDISLGAESAAFGEHAPAHHAGSLLLHALNALLLFLIIFSLMGNPWAAFCAALLWAVHPAQAESVCWLSERKNLLYSFFYFAAVLAYLRHARAPGRFTLPAVFGLFLASLLSKASAVTFPFALLLLDVYLKKPFNRRSLAEKAAFFLVAGAFTAVSSVAQAQNGHILTASPVPLFSFYILKTIWPFNLSALYPYAETAKLFASHRILYLAPATAFAAVLWTALKKNQLAAFGLFFFLFNLLPFLLLVPVGPSLAADRYLYMPLAGLVIAAAAGMRAAGTSRRIGKSLILASLAVCLAFSIATASRASVWNSSMSFWMDLAGRYPDNEVVLLNLADANLTAGRPDKAEALFSVILRTSPRNHKALYDLGTLYALTGRYSAAETLLKQALILKPDNAPAWNNLGRVQLKLGRTKEAVKAFLVSTAVDPGYAPAYGNLSEAETALGMTAEADQHRRIFLKLSGSVRRGF